MSPSLGADEWKTIVKFLEQMSTQDNRATTFPIYYVIRSAKMVATREGCGDEIRYYDTECHESWIDQAKYDSLPEDEDETNEDGKARNQYEALDMKKTWKESGMFLTETDAEKHLKLNSYHYSIDAHTYVKHAWRAPELEGFLLALFEYFGVEPRKDKGTM